MDGWAWMAWMMDEKDKEAFVRRPGRGSESEPPDVSPPGGKQCNGCEQNEA